MKTFITPGEPAGIGPDITIQVAQQHWPSQLVVVADPDLLQERAKLIGLPLTLTTHDSADQSPHQPGHLKIIPVSLATPCQAKQLNPKNAPYVLQCLETAANHCLHHPQNPLVTGPIHKSIINDAGIAFMGHTEFLQQYCAVAKTVMLFVGNRLRVALATTHVPLCEVPRLLTQTLLIETVDILHAFLMKFFHIPQPKILVAGLNPHAGEGGYLGREEIDVIAPALQQLRAKNINLLGPLPADTIFTEKYLSCADAILAMYHDQALPVVKQMTFGHSINTTLGLPFIRTSVDHGTALELAGSRLADSGSLQAAIELASTLALRL